MGVAVTTEPSTNELLMITSSSAYKDTYTSMFQGLPIGEHGYALLLSVDGSILISNSNYYNDRNITLFDLYPPYDHDPLITVIKPYLIGYRAIIPGYSQFDLTLESLMLRSSVTVSLTIHSLDDYQMQIAPVSLSSLGLPWFIVIITKTTDFDGGILDTAKLTGITSAVILSLSIVVSAFIVRYVSIPLISVVRFMVTSNSLPSRSSNSLSS